MSLFKVIDKITGKETDANTVALERFDNHHDSEFAITNSGALLLIDEWGSSTFLLQDEYEVRIEINEYQDYEY